MKKQVDDRFRLHDREMDRNEFYLRMLYDPIVTQQDMTVALWCLLTGHHENEFDDTEVEP